MPGGAISFYPDSSQFLKRDNNNYNWQDATGTYHIVPGYVYQNNTKIREYEYLYPKKGIQERPLSDGDYDEHYYEQPDCTITLKIDTGMNLELPSENGEQIWTNFPVPTDCRRTYGGQQCRECSGHIGNGDRYCCRQERSHRKKCCANGYCDE